ncbi:CLUMA_CG020532, isoform A [Clunio marinus]|uniref:CLUMA_CG020532, isoform A n=1 Tax=Clunio marinus TaxID=568069 RepID=A0A1J1J5A1_9DIPT|nr:CLUMA_CG020532, isoform A [Clunio marinus]
MINAQRQRVEQELTTLVDNLDKSYLRRMQSDMHQCASKCCEDTQSSMDTIQRCIERCSQPVNKAQRYVQSELERVQGRLQRCVMDCNDNIKDRMPTNPSETEVAKFTTEFERCAIKCVDGTVETLPSLFKTMKSVLGKGPQAIPDV